MNTNENQTPATAPVVETPASTPAPTPTTPATPTTTTPEQPKTTPTKPKVTKKTTTKAKSAPKPKTATKPKATKKTTPKAKKTQKAKGKTKTTARADREPRIKEKAPTIPAKLVGIVKAAKTSREKRRILALGLALKGKVQIEVFRSACYHLKCYNSANFAQDISKERDNGILQDIREKVKGKRARRVGFTITAKGRKVAAAELKG